MDEPQDETPGESMEADGMEQYLIKQKLDYLDWFEKEFVRKGQRGEFELPE